MFGKWHLGNAAGRAPTNQGFDEWYGIRDSSNESQRSTMNDTPYIWEGKAGEPSTAGEGVQPRDAPHRRSRGHRAGGRLHDAQHAGPQAVLPLPSVHADPLPDAAAPGVRGQDRRRRHRRRDGGNGSQRRRRAGRDRAAGHRAQHDRHLGQRRRRRGAPAVARNVGPWRGFYNTAMEGGIRTPVHDPLARPHPRRTGLQRDRAQHRRLHDAGARGRRRGAEGPRHRRRRPAAVLRGQSGESNREELPLLRPGRSGPGGQVGRLEAALRLAGRAGPAGRARR